MIVNQKNTMSYYETTEVNEVEHRYKNFRILDFSFIPRECFGGTLQIHKPQKQDILYRQRKVGAIIGTANTLSQARKIIDSYIKKREKRHLYDE